jgi:recombinational DNA repair protein RecR
MDQNATLPEITGSTTMHYIKVAVRAFAPVAVTLGVGVACGILIEKMKNKSGDNTEA